MMSTTTSVPLSTAQYQVLKFIDATFDQILYEITRRPFGDPSITLRRIKSLDVSLHPLTQQPVWNVYSREVNYKWPGRNKEEAWRFGYWLKYRWLLGLDLQSQRDIYYHNLALFKTQETVDRYIDDIAYTCEVSRQDLNVCASPKGMCVGLATSDQETKLICGNEVISRHNLEHIKWILVVEKEATFNSLVEHSIHHILPAGQGVMITGRGYPDLATRQFLRSLTNEVGDGVPVYGLVDMDPDGLEILRCYAVGSRALAQEAASSVPQIIWLGMRLEDVALEDCVPLTSRDRSKAYTMLTKSTWYQGCPGINGYREELQKMLALGVKAEAQALEGGREVCVDWLAQKMLDSYK